VCQTGETRHVRIRTAPLSWGALPYKDGRLLAQELRLANNGACQRRQNKSYVLMGTVVRSEAGTPASALPFAVCVLTEHEG